MKRVSFLFLALWSLSAACGEKQDPYSRSIPLDSGTGVVTYTAFIEPILSQYCVSCHASTVEGAARAGAPVGVDFDSYQAASANAESANSYIQAGAMPPSAPLSDEDKALVQAWLDAGLPE